MQKILEQNGIETENIDGAGFNNFTAGNRDGIIKGILNECTLYQPSSNSIAINTGEIIIKGFRIKIVDTEVKTFSSLPAVPEKWHIVARVELYSDSTLIGGLLFRNETTLIQDDLLKNEQGIYEAEVGEFVLSNSGVSDIVRTMKVIVGGTNASGESGKIEANPPQEPTEELKKLSVGDTTYSVVSSAELNKKLNLVETTDTLQRAYVINANGTQTILPILNSNVTGLTLVQRTTDGRIVCNANSASPNGTAMTLGLFKNMGQVKLYQHNIVINSKYCFSIMCSRSGALNNSTEALSYLATYFINNFGGYTNGTKGGVVGFEINGSTITQKVFTSVEEKSNGVYLLSFADETYPDEEIDTLVDTPAVLL